MFKKLKEKITEEVKSSPQRFAEFTQSVSDRLQNSSTSDENFFSIAEDDQNMSVNSNSSNQGFSSVPLVSPSQEPRSRKLSNSSLASDVSFLPRYESGSMYHLQSDLDVSASEMEDNASSSSQLGHLSKEQIYSAFQKSQMRYHKYRGRYTDLARHYKELERENSKMKSVLVETQDKALRRVQELKEQCKLEQEAKAHLEMALRDEIDERNYKIKTLQTKIELLQNDSGSSSLISNETKETDSQSETNLENLTKYLTDARKEIEVLMEKNQELKANAIIYQSKEQELKLKITYLEKEIAQCLEREKENNLKFAQNKMDLHNEMLSKEIEINNMKKDMEVLKQKLEISEGELKLGSSVKIENLQTQNQKLIERLENLTQKCNSLESELLKVNSYKIEIENALKREIELKSNIESLQKTNTDLINENNKLQKQLEDCKQEVNKHNEVNVQERSKFEEQIANLREDATKGLLSLEPKIREKLQAEFLQKETEMNQDFLRKLNELSINDKNHKNIEFQVFEKDATIQKITEELLSANNELTAKTEAYSDLEKNHLELITECAAYRDKIANFEKDCKTIEGYEQKSGRLKAHIKTLQDEVLSLKEDLKEKQLEINNLQSLLQDSNNKVELYESSQNENREGTQEDEGFEEKDNHTEVLKQELQTRMEEINHLEHILNEEKIKNSNLYDKKLRYKDENVRLLEKIRIAEEQQEAEAINKMECGLLEMKLKTLEDENCQLKQTFENELEILERHMKELQEEMGIKEEVIEDLIPQDKLKNRILDFKRICSKKEQEILYLSQENEKLIQKNSQLSEQLRLSEEKSEMLQLEATGNKMFELKYQELEKDKNRLQEEFEKETKKLTELLRNHRDLQEKDEIIEKLNDQVIERHQENSNLLVMLEKQKQNIATIEHEKEELINGSNNLKTQLQQLETEKRNLLDKLKLEQDNFNKTCATKEKDRELLNEKNESLCSDISRYQEKIEKLECELLENKELINILNSEISLLKEKSTKLETENKNLNNENNNLLHDLEEKNKDVSEFSKKIHNLSGVIEKQTRDFNGLLKRTQELEETIDITNKKNAESLKMDKDRQNEHNLVIENLHKELELKTSELKVLTDKMTEFEKSYQAELNDHRSKLQELETANKKLSELKVVEGSYKKLESEKESLANELDKLKIMEKEKMALEKKLQETESDLKTKTNNLRIKDQECLILKNEHESLLVEIEKLREKLNSLNAVNNTLQDASSKLADTEKRLLQVLIENESSNEKLEKSKQEITELTNRLKQISADNKNIADEYQTLLADKEELKLKLEMLENEINSFSDKERCLNEENKNLTMQLQKVNVDFNDIQKQNIELANKSESNSNEDFTKLQKEYYEIKEKCDTLSVENKNQKADYSKLEEQWKEATSHKNKLDIQIRELETQYTELLHEKQLLQDEVHELKITPVNYQQNTSSLDQLNILKKEQELKSADNDKQSLIHEIEMLHDKLTKYKSLDLTNKSSIEFYENELQKMKNQNDKLNRKLDETIVTLNHCAELSSSTEVEYLKNVLYNYMLGKESIVLARVIAAVCKFDPQQTDLIMQKEQQKQTLLGQLGLI